MSQCWELKSLCSIPLNTFPEINVPTLVAHLLFNSQNWKYQWRQLLVAGRSRDKELWSPLRICTPKLMSTSKKSNIGVYIFINFTNIQTLIEGFAWFYDNWSYKPPWIFNCCIHTCSLLYRFSLLGIFSIIVNFLHQLTSKFITFAGY